VDESCLEQAKNKVTVRASADRVNSVFLFIKNVLCRSGKFSADLKKCV
jgi:hypothetical protein